MKIFKYRFWDSIHLFLSSLSFFPWLQFKTAFLLLDVIVINFVHSINLLRTVGVRALKIDEPTLTIGLSRAIENSMVGHLKAVKRHSGRLKAGEGYSGRLEAVKRHSGRLKAVKRHSGRLKAVTRHSGRLEAVKGLSGCLESVKRQYGRHNCF